MSSDGKLLPMNVKVGDIVLFEKYAGREIKIDNEKYMIISQDNILFIK